MLDRATLKAARPGHPGIARPSLDPYGELLRALMPEVAGVAFYDACGTPLWISDDYHGPDPQALVDEALREVPPPATAEADGFARQHADVPAYAFRVRDERGEVAAVCCLLTRGGEGRCASQVESLVKPALECLRREFEAQACAGRLARNLEAQDRDLALLLETPGDPGIGDELGMLAQKCVDHLGCELAALVVPERAIAVCKAPAGLKPRADVLTRTHRHLLNWAQLQRRTLVVNRLAPAAGVDPLPSFRILSVPIRHSSGRVAGFLALFREERSPAFDRRSEQLAELVARRAAGVLVTHYDPLTTLLTRPALAGQVRGVLAADPPNGPHAVLYLDIDGMHGLNENFGMEAGDEIIGKVAEVLRRRPRANSLAGRLSGDRFAIFLPGCGVDEATAPAEVIRSQCAELSCARAEVRVPVSVSIGVAIVPEGASAFEHGLAQAEIACKAARLRGRGKVANRHAAECASAPDPTESAMLVQLRSALDGHGFSLYAQPMLPLTGAEDRPRFELLLRVRGDGAEMMGPAKFLAIAARHDLLTRVDRWVVGEALRRLNAHASALAGASVGFAINLSAAAVADLSFHDFVEAAVRNSAVSPASLCFEITEAAAAVDLSQTDRLVQRLRMLGCRFALDDFGAGLSAFGPLKTLPVSALKIDGDLVREASTNQRAEAMVRAITQLARSMGMETIAEFVETDESRTRMASLGVDYGQGFAIGRPAPLDDVLADLALYKAVAGWE